MVREIDDAQNSMTSDHLDLVNMIVTKTGVKSPCIGDDMKTNAETDGEVYTSRSTIPIEKEVHRSSENTDLSITPEKTPPKNKNTSSAIEQLHELHKHNKCNKNMKPPSRPKKRNRNMAGIDHDRISSEERLNKRLRQLEENVKFLNNELVAKKVAEKRNTTFLMTAAAGLFFIAKEFWKVSDSSCSSCSSLNDFGWP